VHVYVDGAFATATTAVGARADLPQPWNGYGDGHGFALTLDLAAGSHRVCAYGINLGTGHNALLGCGTRVVRHSPFGNLSSALARPDGVAVRGWAIDPDTTGAVTVRVSVDGGAPRLVAAGQSRTDLGTAYPDYGPAHAFAVLVHPAKGRHRICVTADNARGTPGAATGLGCRTLTL
jgi:hypothetical protein